MAEAAPGRVLWVTGAGSGMGRAAAVAAAHGGRRVALSGRRPDALEAVAGEVRSAGSEALVVPLDVTDVAAIEAAHATIRREWGHVDDLVLSAGLNTPRRTWSDQRMDDFQAIVATNLTAVAAVVQVSIEDLRAASGVVVVISSVAGWGFKPGTGIAYAASKTAAGVLCRDLNVAEWPNGVRATHLCPGDVDTDFLSMRPQVPDAAGREGMLSPADVARAVLFALDAPPQVRIDELVITPTHLR
ncbi:SDR family oxidoreductase [Amnibacterium sp.]|uniref:SDR family oxidoreductase n=1 Tax=Amnibacterium sp. TaxID=1872496 RepID=UPI002615BDEB|nr:SDR family NAD(P)-dependent oxidoreductase [Amnibacterium sp.]MCU1474076.1 short-chain dehydrogenase/reductase [Amnibacterium sp.]